jgi:hypothetical protein
MKVYVLIGKEIEVADRFQNLVWDEDEEADEAYKERRELHSEFCEYIKTLLNLPITDANPDGEWIDSVWTENFNQPLIES